jgi:hypothetical protein
MIKLVITTSENPKKKYKAVFTKPDGKTKTIHLGLVVMMIIYNLMTRIKETGIENVMKKI